MLNSNHISQRPLNIQGALILSKSSPDLSPLEISLLSSRGASKQNPELLPLVNTPLKDLSQGAARLVEAILKQERIVVVADYDCDGATACAVVVSGLRAMGANIGYVVPDRMVHGYGISPSVVDLALDKEPSARILVTVDNGILGHSGISYAGDKGLDVIVTDHHLPGDSLPDALATINPSREDCNSQLQTLAGVSVALWLVLAVKSQLTAKDIETPVLNFLLPLVAVGTIADLVPLSPANRRLVSRGMALIRQKKAPVGILALIEEAGLLAPFLTTTDIAFGLAPRINAAGRLETMNTGIDLLISTNKKEAKQLAALLSETNETRKKLQKEASKQAQIDVNLDKSLSDRHSIVQFNKEWHPGIIGLVASKLKEEHFRPCFVFSMTESEVKGSGRSIPGFHLKDALEEVARRSPNTLQGFGGHAMAAGAQLANIEQVEVFERVFEDIAQERITEDMLNQTVLSDGSPPKMTTSLAIKLLSHPWGQGFEAPAFDAVVSIKEVKALGKGGLHWRIKTEIDGNATEVVLFNQPEPVIGQEYAIYLNLSLNSWRGKTNFQWIGTLFNT